MRKRFGHQNWWPGDTPFEIAIGAILTQNTSWTNVEMAIANLRKSGLLAPRIMFALPAGELAELIRPAGYFNLKAERLRNFLAVLVGEFDAQLDRMLSGGTSEVRERLLAINGIGRETADSILLYAGTHHSFVIDAYTRRVFERHRWWGDPTRRGPDAPKTQTAATYESLKQLCESSLNGMSEIERLDYWRDYHAQLVMVGKDYCRPQKPKCDQCPLKPLLPKQGQGKSE